MQIFFLALWLSVSCLLSPFAFSSSDEEEKFDKFKFSQLSKELDSIDLLRK